MEFTIAGISDTSEPTIYVDRDVMVLMTSTYINFITESEAREKYDDYEGENLGITEDGKIKVLVPRDVLQSQYRKYMVETYQSLEVLYNRMDRAEKERPSRRDEELIAELTKEYQDEVARLGMTYEEYIGKRDNQPEYAGAYKEYSYEDFLTERMRYVTTGCFPERYGVDYIISDDSCQFMAKTIIDRYKQCYIYIEGDDVSSAIKTIRSAIPEETLQKLTVSIVNEYQDTLNSYNMERRQKIGARVLMLVTIGVITMMILYFMMKANAVSRMQDLGVYRMLGISKYSIIGMFAYENFLITTKTSLVGALLTVFISYVIAQVPAAGYEFYYPWYLLLATILLIYLFNILIGILPIRKMLKLPPAQLAAKYDI